MIWRYVIIALAVLVPSAAYVKKALTLSAALLAVLMIIVALTASVEHASFLISAFLLITVIDKLCKRRLEPTEEDITQKTGARDIIQVFSNGGVSMICVLLWHITGNSAFLLCFAGALVESLGDSAASDIGIAVGQQAYDICRFRKIKTGLSGGITVAGTLGCVVACLVLSTIAFALKISSGREILLLTFSAFLSCMMDSILGSLVQRKNKCPVCGKITEKQTHCNCTTEYYSGVKAINNDMVNLICNAFAAITVYVVVMAG